MRGDILNVQTFFKRQSNKLTSIYARQFMLRLTVIHVEFALINGQKWSIQIENYSRNQYASPPRQCNTGRPLVRFLSDFFLQN